MLTSKLPALLEIVDKKRDEIVPCLLGNPGIGKTQGIYEFAKAHDRQVVEIIASQIMPSEVSGITMPDSDTKSMQVFDHARLSSLKDGDILFFDELLQAPQAVLSACLTLIQERRMMSGKKLPDIMIVAAANPLRSPTLIAESIRQRFMFIELDWDSEAWCDYVHDKYDCQPTARLVTLINAAAKNSDRWNNLTPRTATKLLAWYQQCEDESERILFKDTLNTMFNSDSVFMQIELSCKSSSTEDNVENAYLIHQMATALTELVGINDLQAAVDCSQHEEYRAAMHRFEQLLDVDKPVLLSVAQAHDDIKALCYQYDNFNGSPNNTRTYLRWCDRLNATELSL